MFWVFSCHMQMKFNIRLVQKTISKITFRNEKTVWNLAQCIHFFNGNMIRNWNTLLVLVLCLQEKSFDWQCLKNFEMILRFLITLYVLIRTKSATKYIILWKVTITSFKISNCFYLAIFHKKSQGTKYGDQTVHFFDVTPYIIFTHPVFLHLYWHYMTSMEFSFPTIYNFMGVKCTHYKLCSVQSKLVYSSQFWGMKHFLGPVCDIWPIASICTESPKQFWSYIKSLKVDSVGIPILRDGAKLEADNANKAEILNRQFKSVFTAEDPNLPHEPDSNIPPMPDITIST